jgi:hypothetical protein
MKEQLMKQVERVVRPVRAGNARKMQVREELLAHLTALYEEERERLRDDDAALSVAMARFGDPGDLAAELDAAVGPMQRMAYYSECYERWFVRRFEFRSGWPLWFNMARTGGNLSAAIILYFAVAIGVSLWLIPERRHDTAFLPVMMKVVSLAVVSGCVILWAAQASVLLARDTSRPAPWAAILSQGFAWSGALLAAAAIFWWSATGSLEAVFDVLPRLVLIIMLGFPATLVLIAWVTRADWKKQRVHRAWAELEIDE